MLRLARIVTSVNRPKRPPSNRKPKPAIRRVDCHGEGEAGPGSGDARDLTSEEHQRRGDAADALFQELVRRATGRSRGHHPRNLIRSRPASI